MWIRLDGGQSTQLDGYRLSKVVMDRSDLTSMSHILHREKMADDVTHIVHYEVVVEDVQVFNIWHVRDDS